MINLINSNSFPIKYINIYIYYNSKPIKNGILIFKLSKVNWNNQKENWTMKIEIKKKLKRLIFWFINKEWYIYIYLNKNKK